jgi:hypothetical protein
MSLPDPETRTIEALALRGGACALASRLEAGARGGLSPFEGLVLDVGALFA